MDDDSYRDDARIKDIIYKRKNDYDIVNDAESIASCKREQNRDVIDNSRLGSYDKYGNYVIIPEIKRELIEMPKLIYNQYSANGMKIYELKSTIPIFNDVFLKLVISGDMANLTLCEHVNREAGGYLEVYDEVIDSTAMGEVEKLPLSIVFRNYNIFEDPNDFGKELKNSKFENVLTRKVYLSLLSKELRSVSTTDEKDSFKKMVSTLKQSGDYGKRVLDEFLSRLRDRPAIFEITKAENYNKAMNEVLLSSLEIATTEQDKKDTETRQVYLSVLNIRDQNIDEDLVRANDRVSEDYVKHIVDKAKSDFSNEQTSEEETTASDEFYAKLSSSRVRVRTLDKPILKQGKEGKQEPVAKTKEERIKQILAQKEKNAKKTSANKKLSAAKGKKQVNKKLKAGAKTKKASAKSKKVVKKAKPKKKVVKAKVKAKGKVKKAKPKASKKFKKSKPKKAKKRVKPKKAKVKSKKKVKKVKKKTAKKRTAKKKVKRKLAKRNLKAKKGKVKAKKKKVKKPKNAKKAKKKADKLKSKKPSVSSKFKTSAPKKSASKAKTISFALKAQNYEGKIGDISQATLSYKTDLPKVAKVKVPVQKEEMPKHEEEAVPIKRTATAQDTRTQNAIKNLKMMVSNGVKEQQNQEGLRTPRAQLGNSDTIQAVNEIVQGIMNERITAEQQGAEVNANLLDPSISPSGENHEVNPISPQPQQTPQPTPQPAPQPIPQEQQHQEPPQQTSSVPQQGDQFSEQQQEEEQEELQPPAEEEESEQTDETLPPPLDSEQVEGEEMSSTEEAVPTGSGGATPEATIEPTFTQ